MNQASNSRRRSITRVLYDIAQLFGSADAPDARLRRVLELLREVVPSDVCALLVVERATQSRILVEPEPTPGERIEIFATLERLLSHLLAEQAHEPARAARPTSTAGTLAIPLVWSAEVIGIIFVRRASGTYSESHLRVLAIVSGQIAAYLSMQRAHDRMESRAREIDAARRAALAADQAKDELLAQVSQQLKSPLAATLAWAHVLLAAKVEQAMPNLAVAAIERNARVLDKLIDDIQRLASAASAELGLDPHPEETSPVLGSFADGREVVAGDAQGSAASPGAGDSGSRVLEGISVLLVDDDPDIREAFQLVLELYGATVTVAASAAAGLSAFEDSRPDVLLCDLCMPGGDGYDLMREIAARDPELPAAALTAFADIADRGTARRAGFTVQLAKPLEAAALVKVVLELAGSTSAAGARRQKA